MLNNARKKWELRLISYYKNDEESKFVKSSNMLESRLYAMINSEDHDRMLTEAEFDELVEKLKQEYFSQQKENMNYEV